MANAISIQQHTFFTWLSNYTSWTQHSAIHFSIYEYQLCGFVRVQEQFCHLQLILNADQNFCSLFKKSKIKTGKIVTRNGQQMELY